MPQLTLYAPDISCDHCIATIRRTVEAQPGARFLAGDIEQKRFSVEVDGGAALDALALALAEEGYPLGDAGAEAPAHGDHDAGAASGPTHPEYRVTATAAGADVNYDCPCGCTAGFAYDRAMAEQAPESCCCGRTMLVGRHAGERLLESLHGAGDFQPLDIQTVAMPWGQPLEAALATPAVSSHSAHEH
jgi:copper chaperone CopZ